MIKFKLFIAVIFVFIILGIGGCSRTVTDGCSDILSYQIGDKEYPYKEDALNVAEVDINNQYQLIPHWYRSELKSTCKEFKNTILFSTSFSYESRVKPIALWRVLALGFLVYIATALIMSTRYDSDAIIAFLGIAISTPLIAGFFYFILRLLVYALQGEDYYIPYSFILFFINSIFIFACSIASINPLIHILNEETPKIVTGVLGVIVETAGFLFTVRDIFGIVTTLL